MRTRVSPRSELADAYARQAKDTELIQWATEIKVRAERKCGALLAVMEKNPGGRPGDVTSENLYHAARSLATPTLADMGLTANQSSRYQQLAAMPDAHFETAVATAKDTAAKRNRQSNDQLGRPGSIGGAGVSETLEQSVDDSWNGVTPGGHYLRRQGRRKASLLPRLEARDARPSEPEDQGPDALEKSVGHSRVCATRRQSQLSGSSG